MKRIFLVIGILLIVSSAFSNTIENITIKNFKAEGNGIINEQLSEFPLIVKNNIEEIENNGITITGQFSIPKNLDDDLGLILYKNLMSCDVYVNGILLDKIGRSGKKLLFSAIYHKRCDYS